jgi:hypothetical protein
LTAYQCYVSKTKNFRYSIDSILVLPICPQFAAIYWPGRRVTDNENSFIESISPTFYGQLFRTKVIWALLGGLKLTLILFWRKKIGVKAARIILVKLTQG